MPLREIPNYVQNRHNKQILQRISETTSISISCAIYSTLTVWIVERVEPMMTVCIDIFSSIFCDLLRRQYHYLRLISSSSWAVLWSNPSTSKLLLSGLLLMAVALLFLLSPAVPSSPCVVLEGGSSRHNRNACSQTKLPRKSPVAPSRAKFHTTIQ